MKFAGIFVAILLFAVAGARAQAIPATPYLLLPPQPALFTPALTAAMPSLSVAHAMPAPAPAPVPAPQGVAGVFPEMYWQVYLGYVYNRFYEVPGTVAVTYGVEGSMAYYFKPWLAAEGEVEGGFGRQLGKTTKFAFGGGGLRARWQTNRPYDLWIHAVAGGAHFLPATTYGGTDAFAYELGGGLDLIRMRRNISVRLEADLLGTMFFSTYQVSPKLSAGIVYNF